MNTHSRVAIVTGAGTRHRQGRRARAAEGRLPRRARRTARGAAEAGDRGRRRRRRQCARRAHRRQRSRLGAGAVRADEGGVRPPRSAVQQRRHRRAGVPTRGSDVRAVEERRRHQPDRRVPVHAGGVPADEEPDAARRPHHQQRLDLGARAAAEFGALHGDQARDHRPDQVDVARRPQVRHRLRPDRHRQRGDRDDRADGEGRAAGERRRSPSSR